MMVLYIHGHVEQTSKQHKQINKHCKQTNNKQTNKYHKQKKTTNKQTNKQTNESQVAQIQEVSDTGSNIHTATVYIYNYIHDWTTLQH